MKPRLSHSPSGNLFSGTPMVQSTPAGALHFIGPAQSALPALADQLLRRRSERVRHRIPDVSPAVAVEIDGVFQIIRRQELRQPHGAGPRAFHVGEFDFAVVEDFQRQQEFVAELVLAPAKIGLRGQHPDGAALVDGAAVIGFAAEDRQHNCRRHAELAFDRVERRAILRIEHAALRRELLDGRLLEIIRRRLHEFGLPRRCLSGRPGNTRSGSVRSGSSPRVAVSKVARDMPSACACGHSDCSQAWNAASATRPTRV